MGKDVAMAKTLTIFLAADVSKLNRQLKSAQSDLNIFSNGIGGVAGKLSNLMGPALIGAAAAAGAFAVKLGVDGVKAALEDAASIDKLTQTLENLNLAHQLPEVENAISKFERTLGIADTELRPAYDRLVRSIGDTREATRILGIALDVSAGSGKSLDAVVQALGKAYDGNISGLSRLGAGIDAATLKTGDLDVITGQLAQTFQGQAATAAQTMQGQLKVLQTAVDNVAEAFGTGLLQSLGDTNDRTTDLVQTMQDLEPAMKDLGDTVGTTLIDVLDIAKATYEMDQAFDDTVNSIGPLKTAFDTVTGPFNIFKTLTDGATLALYALGKQSESTPGALSGTVAAAIDAGNAMGTMALKTATAADALAEISNKPSKAFYSILGQLNKQQIDYTSSVGRFTEQVETAGSASRTTSNALRDLNAQAELGKTKFDAQATVVDRLNQKFREQTQDLADAKDAIANYASTLSSEITRGFNLGAGFTMDNGEVDAAKWLAGVDAEVSKYEWYGNVLAAVQRDAGTNGEALRAYLASQGVDQGATMGQALIDNGLVATMGEKLAQVTTKADEVAQAMVPEFLRAGEDSAIEFLNGTSQQLTLETDRLKKIGKNIGKPIGANIKAEIAEAVAQAIKDAEAAGSAARAEVAAREASRQATLTEQATAQSLARLIRNSDSRAGRDVQPVLA
jgi:hypothetical protein